MKIKAISIAGLFSLLFFGYLQTAAQTYPARLLTEIPESAQILESPDVRERAAILNKLVVPVPQSCTLEQALPVKLEKEDYEFVVGKILEMDLSSLDFKNDSYIWGKLAYLITRFQMFRQLETLTKYLDHPENFVRVGIVYAVRGAKAKELDYKLVPLLDSPDKFVRESTLETLIELESKRAVPALIKRLAEPDEYSRRYAAMMSLVKVKGTEAAPYVSNVLNDENENNRYWAIDTLVKLDAKSEAPKLWKYLETETNERFTGYAVAALLHFGDKKAVPLALKHFYAYPKNEGNFHVLEFINQLKPKILIPEMLALYYRKERFFEADEFERKMRLTIYNLLYHYRIREAIPIYRKSLFGIDYWDTTPSFKEGVAQILLELNAVEAVDDLIVGLSDEMKNKGSSYYDLRVGSIAVYLAKFGDKKANKILIDAAEVSHFRHQGAIIAELNRQLNPVLWKKLEAAKLSPIGVESLDAFAERAAELSGVKISFEKEATSRKIDCQANDAKLTNIVPCVYADGNSSLKNSLALIYQDHRSDKYTWIIDGERVRILSMEKAIDWWRKNHLKN